MLYASLNSFGVPIVISSQPGEGFVALPEGVNLSEAQTLMCPTGPWEPRPVVDVVVSGNRIDLAGMPPGTVLEVIDVGASATLLTDTLEGDESLMLVDAGSYQIEVTPPMPWLGWQGAVTC